MKPSRPVDAFYDEVRQVRIRFISFLKLNTMNIDFFKSPIDDPKLEYVGTYAAASVESFSGPHMDESLSQGGEYVDDAIRMADPTPEVNYKQMNKQRQKKRSFNNE